MFLSVARDRRGTSEGMTHRLGSSPEYGGPVSRSPRERAGLRARSANPGALASTRAGNGRRSTPEVTVDYVAPTVENVLEAVEALSSLLLGQCEPPSGGRRRSVRVKR